MDKKTKKGGVVPKTRSREKQDPERAALRAELRTPDSAAERAARVAAEAALEKKAEEVVLIDLRAHSSYTDFLVICSGGNERQLDAILGAVEHALKGAGYKLAGAEGSAGGRWVLLDAGDVVVHVFLGEERAHYDLEGLWSDAPQTKVHARAAAQG